MAKRARGSTIRPGQRARLQRGAARPAGSAAAGSAAAATPLAAPKPASLTPEEEARAAELEAKILDEERAAEASVRRPRGRRDQTSVPVERQGTLAVRAADEYAYVVRDVRRIALVGGSLVAFLFGLYAVAEITGFTKF
jgi:hypothetical protein